jgi:hypothetical protein
MYYVFDLVIGWHDDVKGHREKTGWHPATEESGSFLQLGKFWIGFGFSKVPS